MALGAVQEVTGSTEVGATMIPVRRGQAGSLWGPGAQQQLSGGGGHQGGQVNLTADGGEGEGGHGEQPGFWLGQLNRRRSHVLRRRAGGYSAHTPPHDASPGELLGTAAEAWPGGVAEKARRQERLTWQAC